METKQQTAGGKTVEELEAELKQMREQQSILRKALRPDVPSSPTYEENLDQFGDEPEEIAAPLEDVEPLIPLEEGQVRLGDVPLGSLVRVHDLELRLTNHVPDSKNPMVTGYGKVDGERRPMDFRASLPCVVLEGPPASNPNWRAPANAERMPADEVGASLTEHLEAQVPQKWSPELIRNDIPAYVAPQDRNGWLPVPEGSWWLWSSREDKAIVQVLGVEGPSPEARVTIKVPFSTTPQNWKASDFGAGQRFEPLPEYKGLFFTGPGGNVFLVEDIQRDQVLAHDHGAAEPEWDDFSAMLRAMDKGNVRPATLEEAEAWRASFEEDRETEGNSQPVEGELIKKAQAIPADPEPVAAPIPERPPENGNLLTQAREWLNMVHGYPSLGIRQDHGLELLDALAEELKVEPAYPLAGESDTEFTDAIARELRSLLERAEMPAEEPARDPVTDATIEEIRQTQANEPAPVEPKQTKRKGGKVKEKVEQAEPQAGARMTLDDLERCIKLNNDEIARIQAENQKLQAKAIEIAAAERRELEERQRALEERLRTMGISA